MTRFLLAAALILSPTIVALSTSEPRPSVVLLLSVGVLALLLCEVLLRLARPPTHRH